MLADFGAEVIKVEEPQRGDPARHVPPLIGSESAYFLNVNRNKKSITLNLRSDRGREVFYRLVKSADVVVENFRPEVKKHLRIEYDEVKNVNPRIIYCSITGYGQAGPYSNLPGHDINYISIAGVLSLIKDRSGSPVVPGVQIADIGACMMATIAILLALIARERTGEGQYIDISMTDVAMSYLTVPASFYFATGRAPRIEELILSGYYPCYAVYKARDGRYLSVGCLERRFWESLCKALKAEGLIPYQWATGEERERAVSILKELFEAKDRDELFKELSELDVCVAPVYTIDETLNDPHVLARGMVEEIDHPALGKIKVLGIPIKLSRTPGAVAKPAPSLGEHTEEILRSLGYSDEDIKELKASGAI